MGGGIRNAIWEAGLIVVLPLTFTRGYAEQFSTPKFFLTKLTIIAGLAVWALGRIWTPTQRQIRFPLGWPLVAFSLAVLVSCLASPVPRFSLMEAEYALCGPAWAVLLVMWERGEGCVHRIAALMGLAGALVAGVTLLQRLGFDPVLLGGYQVDWGSMVARMRLYSTFGNPNYVGGYLIGTIFAALALAAASKSRWAQWAWSGVGLMMLAAIVVTGSRGAWLGLGAGLAVAMMLLLLNNGPSGMSIRTVPSVRSVVGPSAFWLLALLPLSWAERIAARVDGRVYLWRFSWPIFWKHPIVGTGWGAYQLLYLDLQAKFLSAHPDYLAYWTNNRLLHNDLLQLLLETGIAGLAAFIWILWKFGLEVQRASLRSTHAWGRYAIAASVGGVTAILTDSLFNYQFAVPPTYILLFTFLAIPTVLLSGEVEGGSKRPPLETPLTRRKNQLMPWKIVVSMAILVASGCLLWQQTRLLRSERFYQLATDFEGRNDLSGAESTYRRSVDLYELNGRAHFGLSRVLYSRGRCIEALVEIVRAEQTYADSHQEVLRGLILEQMGNSSGALEAYRHAVWLDPTLTTVQEEVNRLSKR